MKLQFAITSTPIDTPSTRDQVLAAVNAIVADQSAINVSLDGSRIRIEVEASDSGRDASFDSDALLELLKQVASIRNTVADDGSPIRWKVGHQLDSCLGTIDEQGIDASLAIELSTAFTVAESLADMMVDGEYDEADFDEASSDFTDTAVNLQNEDEWNSLSSFEETFQRFPELDQN
ncbi:hypothetical protein LOC67_09400 [Stieleria sp. JC731]|uniref:hypothetical protein n=1 Tax=Pirellulaceae TaxID=2691357 RepID=UPI001E2EA3D6|nr:hypothetical protein [Stieleria sp. JC731]MCC9600779.1 hypothetical protein [Stieleria sp. JC731]